MMLQIQNITITHKKDLRELLKDFSFTLKEGDKAALIGEEGNGKSTLLKLIYNEELIEDYAQYSGTIHKNGIHMGYLEQELSEEQKALTVYEFCCESNGFLDAAPKELGILASELGILPELFYSFQTMGSLSGGEKVKIRLAMILLNKPDVLLLDEPSNDIDIETLEWLERLICESKVPVLYISHDEMLLEKTANVIIHMEQIRRKTLARHTVSRTDYRSYVAARSSGLEKQEQQAKNERLEYAKQQAKFQKIQQKVEHQQNAISRQDPAGGRLLKKKMHAVKAMERRFENEFENMTQRPETEDAIFFKFGEQVKMPAGKRVLDYRKEQLCVEEAVLAENIRLEIIGPKHVCIVGKNGVGKSTMLKEIAEKLLERTDIHASYMPQNYEDLLNLSQTPVEFLTVNSDKEEQDRIATYLGSMKYTADEMHHAVRDLSGGQKAKLLLLRMSMQKCDVLILDEPTRNFSPLSLPVIRKMLAEFPGAIISVSHDRKYIEEVCGEIYELTEKGLKKQNRD